MPTTELQVIRAISEIIAHCSDYEDGLRLTVEAIADRMNVDVCSIFVYDERTNHLALEATFGLEQSKVRHLRLAPNEGITGRVFSTGRAANVADKREHPDYMDLQSSLALEYRALLAVPLVVGGSSIGVLEFETKRAELFPEDVAALAKALASPLAVFISNAQLSQRLGRGTRVEEHTSYRTLKGRSITEGVVRGRAHLVFGADFLDAVPLQYTDDIAAEQQFLKEALVLAREEASQINEQAGEILAEADAAIFYAHLLLLEDPTLIQRIQHALKKGCKLRFALKLVAQEFANELEQLDNELMRERLADMKDVILRIYEAADTLEGLKAAGETVAPREKAIIVARELLPSQLIRAPLGNLAGIVCEQGGATTHVAILAKALRVPMIVGAQGASHIIRPNDDLIVDCTTGACYVRPPDSIARKFQAAIAHYSRHRADEGPAESCALAVTRDGVSVRLGGNISLVSELPLLERYGAVGVGLYRTEFMFMIRGTYPSEDEQYEVFRRVVSAAGESSVTVRVLDVGGDKPLPYVDFGQEDNPFLGWRGIRFLLSNPTYLGPHLRAILRTTVHGRVNILLPMVADLDELLMVKEYLAEAEAALRADGIPFSEDYRVGVMIEVPSVLWVLSDMLPYIDFVSLGTNDLTQYTLAVDRGNSRVTQWFRQLHPVVLRIIKETCDIVRQEPDKTVSVCGEVAGLPLAVPLLVGAGLRHLSMNPWRIPRVRSAICDLAVSDCIQLTEEALQCSRDADLEALLKLFAQQHNLGTSDALLS